MTTIANLSRRNFLHAGAVASGSLVLGGDLHHAAVANSHEALARLMAGNQRFAPPSASSMRQLASGKVKLLD